VLAIRYDEQVKEHKMDRACGMHDILVRKPESWRPLGTPRHRGKDNIKTELKEIGCVEWINLAQRISQAGDISRMGDDENGHKLFIVKPEKI
jgi:hypothetical protein